MKATEKISLAAKKAKGARPYFLADKQTEQTLSMVMTLAMELQVANERIASLESLLVQKGVLSQGELDAYQPNKDEVAQRSLATQAFLSRLLRLTQQGKQEMGENPPSMEAIQAILTQTK